MQKKIKLFCGFFLIINFAMLGQEKVRIIDCEKILYSLEEGQRIDSICNSMEDRLNEVGKNCVVELQEKYLKHIHDHGCISAESQRKVEKEFQRDQEIIMNLEEYVKDSLFQIKEELMYDLREYVRSKLSEYSKENDISLILCKDNVEYFKQNLEITDSLINYLNAQEQTKVRLNAINGRINKMKEAIHYSKKENLKIGT